MERMKNYLSSLSKSGKEAKDDNPCTEKNQETLHTSGAENPVRAIIIGAGTRGQNYSLYAQEFSNALTIVGVAEPKNNARNLIQKRFNLPDDRCFNTWEEVCKLPKFADCVFICTQDQDHVGPALEFARKGYHILLEKPMSVTPQDCLAIYEACQKNGIILCVCHVLRYHPSVIKIKEIIDSGLIGDIVNIQHIERVGFWHFAHSFVRGNWGNSTRSTFSLLSKCCHDVDLISYWMSFKKCSSISSFGSLKHFRKENKPKKASPRCLDCSVESSCPYSAKRLYLDDIWCTPRFALKAVCDDRGGSVNYENKMREALKTGPYGRCVYDMDNDVCDNQVVNFQFEDGSTANLTMIAFSKEVSSRRTTIFGTKGELQWDPLFRDSIKHYDFVTKKEKFHHIEISTTPQWGHGGSDFYLIKNFVDSVASNSKDSIRTGPLVSLQSHLLTFAAEYSRLTKQAFNFEEIDSNDSKYADTLALIKEILSNINC